MLFGNEPEFNLFIPYIMNTTTTTTTTESVNALTLCTIADNEQFAVIVSELANLRNAESETARTGAETILDGTLKQALLIAKAKTLTDKLDKEKRPNVEKFADLIGYSYGMTRKYLDLEKAYIKAETDGRDIDTFKALNRSVIANGKRPIYGIQAFTDYLNGLDIYRSSLAKEQEKAEAKKQKEQQKAEAEAEKEQAREQAEAEAVANLRNSAFTISKVSLNGLISEDIQLKIISTDNINPVVLCSARYSDLEKAFNIILNCVRKVENETAEKITAPILKTDAELIEAGQKAVKNKKIQKIKDSQAAEIALEDKIREAMLG